MMWPRRQTRSSTSTSISNNSSSSSSSTNRIRNTSVHNLRTLTARCFDTLDEFKPQLSSSFSIENALFENEEHNRNPKKKKLIRSRIHKSSTINKFLEDNQSYYKIEIFNGKLRSSSTTSSSSTISTSTKTKPPAAALATATSPAIMKKQQQVTVSETLPVVIKSEPKPIKRRSYVRTSEIALLNSEAVKFLFPPSPKSSRSSSSAFESDTDDPDLKTTPKKRRKQTTQATKKCRLKRKIKREIIDESPNESEIQTNGIENCVDDDESNDAVTVPVLDAVPVPVSIPIANEPSDNSVPTNCQLPQNYFVAHNIDLDEILSNVDNYLDMNCLHNEAWYQTFERQDNFEEDLFKPTFLSVDMIDLLPKTIKVRNPIICRNHFEKLIATNESTTAAKSLPKQTNKGLRKYRKLLVGGSGISRKSPRKHASTLAILSSLKQKNTTVKVQRKSKTNSPSSGTKAAAKVPETDAVVAATATATKHVASSKDDSQLSDDLIEPRSQQYFYEIVQNIYLNESQPEVKSVQSLVKRYPKTVIANAGSDSDIEMYLKALRPQPPTAGRSGSFSSGSGSTVTATRVHRFKRKRNRTGWPKKRRFLTKRKPSPVPVCVPCVPAIASSPDRSSPLPVDTAPSVSVGVDVDVDVDINSNPLPKSPLADSSVGEPPPPPPSPSKKPEILEPVLNLKDESDQKPTNLNYCTNLEQFETATKTTTAAVVSPLKTSPRLLPTRTAVQPSLSSASANTKPFVRLKNFTFNTFRPNTRGVRSASLTTTPNGDYSFRRLRSARNTFFNRTR